MNKFKNHWEFPFTKIVDVSIIGGSNHVVNLYYILESLYVCMFISIYVHMPFMAGQTAGPIALKFTDLL